MIKTAKNSVDHQPIGPISGNCSDQFPTTPGKGTGKMKPVSFPSPLPQSLCDRFNKDKICRIILDAKRREACPKYKTWYHASKWCIDQSYMAPSHGQVWENTAELYVGHGLSDKEVVTCFANLIPMKTTKNEPYSCQWHHPSSDMQTQLHTLTSVVLPLLEYSYSISGLWFCRLALLLLCYSLWSLHPRKGLKVILLWLPSAFIFFSLLFLNTIKVPNSISIYQVNCVLGSVFGPSDTSANDTRLELPVAYHLVDSVR